MGVNGEMVNPRFIEGDWSYFEEKVAAWSVLAPGIAELISGDLSLEAAIGYARRHYAEVRTFVDLKLPCRLRLCPADATDAKAYFWRLYEAEQGFFEPGSNHAEVFGRFCGQLGISRESLEDEWRHYWPNYSYLLVEPPSVECLVRELSVSYAWESMMELVGPSVMNLADKLLGAGKSNYEYFTGHLEFDEGHSNEALGLLKQFASNPALKEVAISSAHDALFIKSPFVLPRIDL
jgi:pyrroloquinoline quinone (PQQ) biosynthesis protein C